ncbi:MAG TPA: tyrosine-type recombinase/integrase, partial [Bacteroidales bacterium]|nr:tyrosine-type recombinase/integrase [Bacteroidales bacterium]
TTELCELMNSDINLKEQMITIKGKGNKIRTVPIGQYCTYYIELYLKESRKFMLKGRKDDPGNLFLSYRGKPFNKSSINTAVMRKVIKNINVKKHISCYSLRHCLASHLLQNKVDLMHIAELLGHASIRTTQHYLHVDINGLKKMHSLYHPREKE